MKTIVLGDTHGRTNWKQISENAFDRLIFIGDYFDTHEDVSPTQQKENFREIIDFKKANRDRVTLLIGNHDYHYLPQIEERYSGFQEWHQTDIGELLDNAIHEGLMQICCVDGTFLFSHAGISWEWCGNNGIFYGNNMVFDINELFLNKPRSFGFKAGKNHSMYGDDTCQGPLWIRPESLSLCAVDHYTQVVGHTTQDSIRVNPDIILIDTLGTSGEYLVIEDGKAVATT